MSYRTKCRARRERRHIPPGKAYWWGTALVDPKRPELGTRPIHGYYALACDAPTYSESFP